MLSILHCTAAAVVGTRYVVPLPALRIGGEWAGHSVAYSADTGDAMAPGVQLLTNEQWNADKAMVRRFVQFHPGHAVATQPRVLPLAQSGSEVLTLGARMLEPEVLNVRGWALDAVDESTAGLWQCEAIFDGLCGDRPATRTAALECPKERTRVQCSFVPATGTIDPTSTVHVCHERCWSVSPSSDLEARELGNVEAEWLESVVGLECFGGKGRATTAAKEATMSSGLPATSAVSLDCGIELRGAPGLLELTLTSGEGALNGYQTIVMRRSWAGDGGDAGCSRFTEVDVLDDTTGDK